METQFPSAQAAWLWTAAALQARTDPACPRPPARACRPEEVVKCLDELYRRRRIDLLHARVLHLYGRRGRAPDPARPRERCDSRIWMEAIDRLAYPLRQRGLLPGVPPFP